MYKRRSKLEKRATDRNANLEHFGSFDQQNQGLELYNCHPKSFQNPIKIETHQKSSVPGIVALFLLLTAGDNRQKESLPGLLAPGDSGLASAMHF